MSTLGIEITEETQAAYDATLKHYCTLSSLVADHVFDHAHAADCFCRMGNQPGPITNYWRHDAAVPQFIEDAVISAVAKRTRLDRKQVRALLKNKRA